MEWLPDGQVVVAAHLGQRRDFFIFWHFFLSLKQSHLPLPLSNPSVKLRTRVREHRSLPTTYSPSQSTRSGGGELRLRDARALYLCKVLLELVPCVLNITNRDRGPKPIRSTERQIRLEQAGPEILLEIFSPETRPHIVFRYECATKVSKDTVVQQEKRLLLKFIQGVNIT